MVHIPNFNENVHNKDHFCPNFILRPDLYAKMVPKFFSQNFRLRGGLDPKSLGIKTRVLLARVYGINQNKGSVSKK